MKAVFVLCLVALAAAAPRPQDEAVEVVEAAEEEIIFADPDPAPVEAAPFVAPVEVAAPVISAPGPNRAAPAALPEGEPVAILRDERVDHGDGNFNYNFEANNGISMQVSGTPGAEGAVNMEGFYLLPLADGGFAEIRFIANENGFQPQGDILPTPHPLPAHAIEQIRFAEEQRALGVTFE